MAMPQLNSTGYGPSNQWQNLVFDGDERKFEVWETKILGYFKLKKLKDTLVGTTAVDPDKNDTAFAELIQFLDERSLSLIIREAKDDGRKAFKILKEFYAGNSKPRVITLYNQLTTLSKSKPESVTDYLMRAEKAAVALKSAGENVSDSLLIAMVLKGLPDEFKAFIAIITQSETVDTFQKFKQALRNFDETETIRANTKKAKDSSNDSIMKAKNGKPITCFNCGIPGHKSVDCRQKKWCSVCKSSTHTDKSCRRKQRNNSTGNRDHANKTCDETESNKHSFAFKINEASKNDLQFITTTDNQRLLVDCGATTHIVNKDDNFTYVDSSFNPADHYIELADGSRSNNIALKRGTVTVYLKTSEGQKAKVYLENTLFKPTYPQNIFSVQAATKKGASLKFNEHSAELLTSDGTKFEIEQHGRLYYLYKNSVTEKRSETLKTWHQILGHCNVNDISKQENVVQGMKINNRERFDCEVCTMSKQPNERNREADVRAKQPFELVHTDLSGPIDPVAKDGFKYAMIFTDDFSSCNFTYFLKEKSDAPKATEKFLADIAPYGKVKTLSFFDDVFPSGEIKKMRSDNGGEYISSDFKEILIKHSIRHELSAPYSPHQNGTAERNWRTLFEMGRALLMESGLPKFLWTYAVMTATHIRNRCYVKRINTTPYGLITGIKPNVANLHIFGTVCYAFIHGQKKKLDPRCRKGYFVGYDKNSPSYLVYHPETRSIGKHRLVKFTDQFAVADTDANTNTNNLFPDHSCTDPEPKTTDPTSSLPPTSDQPTLQPTNAEATTEPNRYPQRNRKQPERFGNNIDDELLDYVCTVNVPTTYNEAVSSPDAENWKQAMDDEIKSLESNDTFTVTEIPETKTVVGGKWVYTVKGNHKNPVYKARYVAKGYSQVEGIDFTETFSPTARMESIRMLTQVAVQNDWSLHQMDVKAAYLHAPIECDVYVKSPPGYQKSPTTVWKLNKSLYGLRQSGRNWHNLLHDYLHEINFKQSTSDPCVFIQQVDDHTIVMLVWVDDIIIASSSMELMNQFKRKLNQRFHMKDLGEISSFLGIQFKCSDETVTISQSKYLKDIVSKFGYDDCKPRSTPCENKPSSYCTEEETATTDESMITKYRQMVGSLIYAMTCTRPDLSYCVTKLSQHLSKPLPSDWIMLKHVFRYIKQTSEYELTFRKSTNDLRLHAFCDADWASSLDDRHSISGYCISLNESGPPISWKSKKQSSVALSTCEAEYVSLSITCQESIHLTRLLTELLPSTELAPTFIKNDNQGAIALIKNPVKHMKAKHIDIRYHFVRECYHSNQIVVDYVPSNDNIADIFTKPAKRDALKTFGHYLFGH